MNSFSTHLLKLKLMKTKIKGISLLKIGDNFNNFYKNHLPFECKNQKRVLKEIRKDVLGNAQMNRLLQEM